MTGPRPPLIRRYSNLDAATSALISLTLEGLDAALASRGHATMVLSGGNTPRYYLPRLAGAKSTWSDVSITLADERFVPLDHPDSNEGMIRSCFRDSDAVIEGVRGDAETPEAAARLASKRLIQNFSGPAAVSILGFGPDGHIASLFTAADCRRPSEPSIIATRNPADGSDRLSMTLGRLCAADLIVFVAAEAKLPVLENALSAAITEKPPLGRLFLIKNAEVLAFG